MGKITGFFKDVNAEIRKVVYPGKDELIGSTWVVIITTVIIAIYLGAVDWGLSKFVEYMLAR
jgi:preprotein translocase subunit SecE